MKCKSKLKNSKQYNKVYINMDKPFMERKMENSLRTLINTVAREKLLIIKVVELIQRKTLQVTSCMGFGM